MKRTIEVQRLGRVPYADALQLQQTLQEKRIAGLCPDTVLVLEHPPVITLGRSGKPMHVLFSEERLAALGIERFEIGRGGDVTYHGPGQLVVYPIVDLKPDRCDVRRYIRDLEQCMIGVCQDYGLSAQRIAGLNGTWIDDRKVGAVGVRISRWVSMHGFALNVSTNLEHFAAIVPCGIADKQVTSLEAELKEPPPMADVIERMLQHLKTIFDAELV